MPNFSKPQIIRWNKEKAPSEEELAQLLHDEGLSYFPWSNSPHDLYAPHTHSYDKVIYVVNGSITFILPQLDKTLTLHTGDRLELPAHTIHSAVVGGRGVKCFEAHV